MPIPLRRGLLGFVFMLLLSHAALAQTGSPIGRWNILDKSGAPLAVVETYLDAGKLCGKIVSISAKRTQRSKWLEGTVILNGLAAHGNEWSGGTLFQPLKDRHVDCSLKVIEGGNKLQIRAFQGTPIFGQTLVWPRVD